MKSININKRVFQMFFLILSIIWMGIIFYFSSQPSTASLDASGEILVKFDQLKEEEIHDIDNRAVWDLHYHIRKIAHIIIYFGLGALILFALAPVDRSIFSALAIPWILASLYGVLDEFHQNFIPGRGATLADIKLDSISAFLGVCFSLLVFKGLQRIITLK